MSASSASLVRDVVPRAGRSHLPQATAQRLPDADRASRSGTRDPRPARWFLPAEGPITSGFGPRWGSEHPGIDIGATYGSPVHAVTGGIIDSSGWLGGYGLTVTVRTRYGVFYYPHMSKIETVSGRVHGGQVLGLVGSTGYSTGPHLHLELRVHGRSVDPTKLLRRHGVVLGR